MSNFWNKREEKREEGEERGWMKVGSRGGETSDERKQGQHSKRRLIRDHKFNAKRKIDVSTKCVPLN